MKRIDDYYLYVECDYKSFFPRCVVHFRNGSLCVDFTCSLVDYFDYIRKGLNEDCCEVVPIYEKGKLLLRAQRCVVKSLFNQLCSYYSSYKDYCAKVAPDDLPF